MAMPPIRSLLEGQQPSGYCKSPRRSRYRRHRHRRGANGPRGRSDSESETSDAGSSSDPSTAEHQKDGTKKGPKMIDLNCYVALDCEMVGVGDHGKQSSLARVTLIDWNGTILMDECIRQECHVTDYRTFVSGITPEMLWEARMDLATCRQHVLAQLDGKILVGHGLKNDLRVLGITHPWHMIRDTAKYPPFMKVRFGDGILWPRGLRELCKEKLEREVQTLGSPHSPYEDALAAMDLYRLVQSKWEKSMEYKVKKTRAIEQEQQVLHLGAARE